ncbi:MULTISPECIES: hypothetical protein [Cyanophyceae]|uniref:hypothetical protein n=1 Tax=Cyanophyceae TaxID=3028117 RepID=UPI001A7EADC3|nr:hypothetical protein [Trichocoleus sp. FACHB-6]
MVCGQLRVGKFQRLRTTDRRIIVGFPSPPCQCCEMLQSPVRKKNIHETISFFGRFLLLIFTKTQSIPGESVSLKKSPLEQQDPIRPLNPVENLS